jgi:hypothetical protein
MRQSCGVALRHIGTNNPNLSEESRTEAQVAGERRPDLCLLDASMPAIEGIPVRHIDSSVSVQELFGEVEQLLGADARSGTG